MLSKIDCGGAMAEIGSILQFATTTAVAMQVSLGSPWGHFLHHNWCEKEIAEKAEAQLASEKEGVV